MTVVDVLLPDEDDLLVQFMEVFNELSLAGWRVCDMPWEMKAERKRSVFYNEKHKQSFLYIESGQKGHLKITWNNYGDSVIARYYINAHSIQALCCFVVFHYICAC